MINLPLFWSTHKIAPQGKVCKLFRVLFEKSKTYSIRTPRYPNPVPRTWYLGQVVYFINAIYKVNHLGQARVQGPDLEEYLENDKQRKTRPPETGWDRVVKILYLSSVCQLN